MKKTAGQITPLLFFSAQIGHISSFVHTFQSAPLSLSSNKRNQRSSKLYANSTESAWTNDVGNSALETVQGLARAVATATDPTEPEIGLLDENDEEKELESAPPTNERLVITALAKLEKDMAMLDNIAGTRPSMSNFEASLLFLAVGMTATAPTIFPYSITEFLAPASAACKFPIDCSSNLCFHH